MSHPRPTVPGTPRSLALSPMTLLLVLSLLLGFIACGGPSIPAEASQSGAAKMGDRAGTGVGSAESSSEGMAAEPGSLPWASETASPRPGAPNDPADLIVSAACGGGVDTALVAVA